MKRSEMVLLIAEYLIEPKSDDPFKAAGHILDKVEKKGMLPPVNTCKVIPDPRRPGYHKHSESKREWDEEND